MDDEFGSGFRMLVVEDDDAVAAIVTQVFHAAGFAVDVAWNLKGARERVDARPYDLVLLDKDLPDGSGLELARYLTARQADCEILLMTAHGSEESAFEAFELGLADYIPKPFENLGDLRTRIRKALRRLAESRRAGVTRMAPRESPTPAASESQRRLRFFVEMRVRFILVDGSLTGPAFVSQLSVSDLFVETDRPLEIGSRVRMRLYLPGRAAVDLRGVVRRHGDGPTMMGMRIELTEASDEATAAIANHLAPQRAGLFEATAVVSPTPEGTPPWLLDSSGERPLAERFTPEAFQIFFSMHRGKLLDFLDTLDTATVEAILAADARKLPELSEHEPAKSPAPFEAVAPGLFDPENVDPEALPLGETQPGEPAEPADEEERLHRRYGIEDDLLDESVRKEYGIDESLFDDGEAPARTQAPASSGNVLSRIGESAEQRIAFAAELRRRGEDALARGMVLKASSDLALAVAFDSKDESLQKLYARVRAQANAARAEDLYRQGLQQGALGDSRAASRLLLGACELAPADTKYIVACVRVLLQAGDAESLKACRTLLRDAITRTPENPDLHVLLGKVALFEGQPKAAVRSWQRALEIKPDHDAAKELLARMGKS